MSSVPTDEELMAAYGSRSDATAFAELYRRYESRLFGFFMRRLPHADRALAPDLFQKTWLKIHQSRTRFKQEERLSTWLFVIALNVLRDERRYTAVRQEELDDEEGSLSSAPDPQPDIEQRLTLRQDLARLEAALADLPEAQREALLLSDWEGFTSQEMAKLLQVTEASARQLVSRARRKVRMILEGGVSGKS